MVSNQSTLHRVVAAVLVGACGIVLMVTVRSAQAAAPAPVSVFLKAEHLEGTRPDGGPVTLRLNLDAYGNDESALALTGKVTSTTGAHVVWSMTGSIDGDVVTFTGVVTDSNNPVLIGMTGWLVANAATGTATISWQLADLPPGIASGEAKVDIRAS